MLPQQLRIAAHVLVEQVFPRVILEQAGKRPLEIVLVQAGGLFHTGPVEGQGAVDACLELLQPLFGRFHDPAQGGKGLALCTPQSTYRFNVPQVSTVSTIGAGDNFNAGFIYGLVRHDVRRADLPSLPATRWEQLIDCGRRFAANVCASIHNSIDEEFGRQMAEELQ